MKKIICIIVSFMFVFGLASIGEAKNGKKRKKEVKSVKEEPAKTDKKEVVPNHYVDEDLVKAAQDKSSTYGLRKYIGQEERDINSVDKKFKRCILSWAILSGNNEAVEYLLSISSKRNLKLDLDQKDVNDKSPRDYANEKGITL